MRHVVVLSHPNPSSFGAAVAGDYAAAVRALGHEAEIRDLYAIGFDPRLPASELPWRPGFSAGADVVAERALLADADVVALVYPLWFNAPPAMLKGYVERVFGMGFGYGPGDGGTQPLLNGKRLLSITTSGAPDAWVDHTG